MENVISFIFTALVWIIVGFILGAVFTDYISLNLADTQWSHLGVYLWMLFWPFTLAFMFLFWFVVGVICAFLAAFIFALFR